MTSASSPNAHCGAATGLLACAVLSAAGCTEPTLVNRAPVAFAGYDRDAVLGQPILLDGSLSADPDGNALRYRWSLQTPDGARAALGEQRVERYTPTSTGVHLFFLEVSDGQLSSPPDLLSVRVRAAQATTLLRARAGNSVEIPAGGSATLDGSGSSGPAGSVLRYLWEVVDWPDGAERDRDFALLPQEGAPQVAIFTHLSPALRGAFVIALRVQGGGEESDPDFVTVGVGHWASAVRAEAQPAARVALGEGGQARVEVEAQLFPAESSVPVEWWVLAAPAGAGCPAPGERLSEGTSVEYVPPLRLAHLRMDTACAGVWQLLICPQGAAAECPAQLCCPRHGGRVALTASCCQGLADRLQVLVEGQAP